MDIIAINNLTGKHTTIKTIDQPYVPVVPKAEPTETELLRAEIADLEARLAKVEAVPIVKEALEPVIIKDPIISK